MSMSTSTSTADANAHAHGIPPLPPVIQTTILSHLFPPSVPLPQQLLSKSLLQRHLYLPPSPTDTDAFLSPVPEPGLADRLTRLAGVGWAVVVASSGLGGGGVAGGGGEGAGVEYASDGESVLARVRVHEEGLPSGCSGDDGGADWEGVEVMFEWEGGKDGRGWTYLSTASLSSGSGSGTGLKWTTDRSSLVPSASASVSVSSGSAQETYASIPNGHSHSHDHAHTDHAEAGDLEDGTQQPMAQEAPEGYWAGFSPPASPRFHLENGPESGGGTEDDYWASYHTVHTPGGEGASTPALERSQSRSSTSIPRFPHPHHDTDNVDTAPRDPTPTSSATAMQNTETGTNAKTNTKTRTGSDADPDPDPGATVLRSRMEMKIASILRRMWLGYLPGVDAEYRALTFLSLGRTVMARSPGVGVGVGVAGSGSGGGVGGGGMGADGEEGVRGKMEILYEMYDVLHPCGARAGAGAGDGDKEGGGEGFYRLVEGSLTSRPGEPDGGGAGGGFGEGNRQDSQAQLNYWE